LASSLASFVRACESLTLCAWFGRDINPYFKEAWCKRLDPATLPKYKPLPLPNNVCPPYSHRLSSCWLTSHHARRSRTSAIRTFRAPTRLVRVLLSCLSLPFVALSLAELLPLDRLLLCSPLSLRRAARESGDGDGKKDSAQLCGLWGQPAAAARVWIRHDRTGPDPSVWRLSSPLLLISSPLGLAAL